MDNLYHEIIKAEDHAGGGWFSSLFKFKPKQRRKYAFNLMMICL